MIVAVGGLSGSGKTFTALKLREHFNCYYFSSDKIRKELANISLTQKVFDSFGKGLYSPSFTKKTYEELLRKAKFLSEKGNIVIIDATFSSLEFQKMLIKCGEPYLFIFCYANDEVIKERLNSRLKDENEISDGRWEIYEKQKKFFKGFLIPENRMLKINTENDDYLVKIIKFVEKKLHE